MLKIKDPMLGLLAFMVIAEVLLSFSFNLMANKDVVSATRLGYYFITLFFLALVFYFAVGVVMRMLRRSLAESDTEKGSVGGKADISGRRYYRITLTACGIFMALIYLVRLTLGKVPFKWTCAVTDFANFTGRFNNVYLSIAIFGILLFATVYIAQLGVVKGMHMDRAKKRREREQRIQEDEKATLEFRRREAEAAEEPGTTKDQLPEEESKTDKEAAAKLRTETRSGIDVLKLGGIALKTKEDLNEEAIRASEELRRQKREGVDVLGAVIENNLDPEEKF